MPPKQTKRATGTVGEGAAGKKTKVTQHVGEQSVSEKSQTTRTCKNVFEKSNSKTQYFVREATTMRGVILRMIMGSMRMGRGARVMGQPHRPNGDRLAVFTSQQEQ